MSCYTINSCVCELDEGNVIMNGGPNLNIDNCQQTLNDKMNVFEFNLKPSLNVLDNELIWNNDSNVLGEPSICKYTNSDVLYCTDACFSYDNDGNYFKDNLKDVNGQFVFSNTNILNNENENKYINNKINRVSINNNNNKNNENTKIISCNDNWLNDDCFNRSSIQSSRISMESNYGNETFFDIKAELSLQFENLQLPFNDTSISIDNCVYSDIPCESKKSARKFKSSLTNSSFFDGKGNDFWLGGSNLHRSYKNKKVNKKKVYKMKYKQYNPKTPSPLHMSNCFTESSEYSDDFSSSIGNIEKLELFSYNPFNIKLFSNENINNPRKNNNIFNSFNTSLKKSTIISNDNYDNDELIENNDIFCAYDNYLGANDSHSKAVIIEDEFDCCDDEVNIEIYNSYSEDKIENKSSGNSNSADSVSSSDSEGNNNCIDDSFGEEKECKKIYSGIFSYEGFLDVTDSLFSTNISESISPFALCLDAFGKV